MLVDSDHAGDKLSCRSRSGFLIYFNTAFVLMLSLPQRLKVQAEMMSIPISDSSYINIYIYIYLYIYIGIKFKWFIIH